MAYYRIEKQEMVDLLEGFGFERVPLPDTTEMVYSYILNKPDVRVYLQVYTSIDPRTGCARDRGEDAIRCIFLDTETGKPVGKTARIHRLETWKKNLTNRLRTMVLLAPKLSEVSCPTCGSQMARRKGQFGPFYGCVNFPDCRGVRKEDDYTHIYNDLEEEAVAFLKSRDKWER